MNKSTMLKAALSYAEKGLAVFPLQYKDKIPGTANGVKDATTDLEQINKWWQETPFANIGIAMGKPSGGLIAIDIDVDENKGKNGFESIRDWEKEHGELPETVMTLTGRGGKHMIYSTNEICGNRTDVIHGVDVRSDGGYIVAPPSIHPNGQEYAWEHAFEDCDIAEANKSVLELVRFGLKKEEETEPQSEKFSLPGVIEDGTRNDTLYRYACSLQSKGYEDKDIMELVLLANDKRCKTPYVGKELTELKKSIRSALTHKKGIEKPRVKLETIAGDDLERMDLKPPEFLVSEILPIGVCILGAPPKAGKSWFVLDLALSVARGNKFLGHETTQGEVLYLSLEDSLYRLKQRALKVLGNEPIPRNIHFAIQAPTIDIDKQNEGLMGEIASYMERHPQTSLIIIDTLQMVQSRQGKNEDAYSHTYKLLNAIRPIFTKYNACVMLVHHTRKASKDDTEPFETFLGSQALAGATDGMYIIKKKFKDEVGTLYGRGRDFEEFEYAIKRDEKTCKWINLGEADDIEEVKERERYENSPITITIKEKLKEIQNDNSEIIKEYVVTAKQMQEDVYEYGGEWIGRNEKAFMSEVALLDGMLFRNGIIHKVPDGRTTHKGKPGLYHRFKYKPIKEN